MNSCTVCKVTSDSEIVTHYGAKYTKFSAEEQIPMPGGKKKAIPYVVYQDGCYEYSPGDIVFILNGRLTRNCENKLSIVCSIIQSMKALEALKNA